jgi:hypothetical protein
MSAQHPLAVFLATESEPLAVSASSAFPGYDPTTQLQMNWNRLSDHLEILCSAPVTGDPGTESATTSWGPNNENLDNDVDDSGT